MATINTSFTVKSACQYALSLLGNSTPTLQQLTEAYNMLNLVLAEWQNDPALIHSSTEPPTHYTNDATVITLPYGYITAMIWNVAARLMPSYGVEDKMIASMAGKSTQILKRTNTSTAGTTFPNPTNQVF